MPFVSDLLTASAATVDGQPTPARTWQWLRDGSDISGATSSTYTVQEADLGSVLSVRQTETNFMGTASAISLATAAVDAFSPIALFGAGEEGAWYEPSTTTAFLSTTDLTPCTYGQSCGLLLDKSQGAGYSDGSFTGLGAELVTGDSSTFTSSLGDWTYYTGATATATGGVFSISGIGTYQIGGLLTGGKTYLIEFDYTRSLSSYVPYVGDRLSPATQVRVPNDGTLSGRASGVIFAGTGTGAIGSASGALTIDNISIRELPGNHATQTAPDARPILARVPETGRRNLLERTEEFDDVAWTKINSITIDNDVVIAPDGKLTGDKLVESTSAGSQLVLQGFTSSSGTTYSASVFLKKADRGFALVYLANGFPDSGISVNLTTGDVTAAVGSPINPTSEDFGNGWFRVSFSEVADSTTTIASMNIYASVDGLWANRQYTGDGASGIYIYGAQLETGSTATDYQKVVSEYDVTEAGVTSLDYLSFDGADDEIVSTESIDLSDPSYAMLAALKSISFDGQMFTTDLSPTGARRASIQAASETSLRVFDRGDSTIVYDNTVTSLGDNTVISFLHDLSSKTVRQDGGFVGSQSISSSTELSGSSVAIASSAVSEMNFYGGIVINRTLTTAEIDSTEAYLAAKSGVTIA